MDRINKLKKYFREIHYTHVYRELNKEAYFLSKKELTKTEGKIEYSFPINYIAVFWSYRSIVNFEDSFPLYFSSLFSFRSIVYNGV